MNSSPVRRRALLSLLILISLWSFSGCHKQASVRDVPESSETAIEDRIVVDDWLDDTPDAIYPVQALEKRLADGADVHAIDEERSLTPLLAAALRGDEACFARLRQAGADPNQVLFQENEHKLTPIWVAVDRENARAVRMLLNAGADVHTPRLFHDEPLIAGATDEIARMLIEAGIDLHGAELYMLPYSHDKGNADIIRAFLDAGADVNTRENERDVHGWVNPQAGYTMLMHAALSQDEDLIQLLLSRGADVNIKTKERDGDTALSLALQGKSPEIAKRFVRAGADIHYPAGEWPAPDERFVHVAKYGDAELMDALLAIDAPYVLENKTLLWEAACADKPDVAMRLLAAGVDPNTPSPKNDNRTALWCAIKYNHTDLAIAMIRAGAEVNPVHSEPPSPQNSGLTPLMAAAASGADLDLIKALIAAGADVHAKHWEDVTALMFAARTGNVETVKTLIEAGADVKAATTKGNTAIMFASVNGHADIIKVLLDAGADATATDNCGGTALALAAVSPSPQAVQVLLDAGADANAMLLQSRKNCDPEKDNCACNKDTDSILMRTMRSKRSAGKDKEEIVRMLLAHKADVHVINHRGETAIFLAPDGRIAQLLLEAGARLEGENQDTGETLLMHFASLPDGAEILKRMLADGKREKHDIDALDKKSKSALAYAIANGAEQNAILLIEAGADSKGSLDAISGNCNPRILQSLLRADENLGDRESRGDALKTVLHEMATNQQATLEISQTPDKEKQNPDNAWEKYQELAQCVDIMREHGFTLSDESSEWLLTMHIQNPTILRELIAKGVNPLAENQYMRNMRNSAWGLFFAEHNYRNHSEWIQFLTPMLLAARDGYTESMDILLEHGYDIKRRSARMLVLAGLFGGVKAMRRLIERGADIHQRIQDSEDDKAFREKIDVTMEHTQLIFWAAQVPIPPDDNSPISIKKNDLVAIVRLLLDSGAEVNATDTQGNTALLYAILRSRKTYCILEDDNDGELQFQSTPTIVALIKAGADPHLKNADGVSPMDFMSQKGYESLLHGPDQNSWPAPPSDLMRSMFCP